MRLPSLAFGLTLICALMNPSAALAHAELRSVSPAGHSIVAVAPTIALRYGEPVGITADGVTITGANGKRWPGGPVAADGLDISAPLPTLPSGTFVATWATQAEDGHVQRRASTFAISAPTPVLLPGEVAEAARPTTPTTVVRKPAKGTSKPAPKVGTKQSVVPTTVSRSATVEVTLRSADHSAPITSAVLRLRKLADGRLGAVVQLPVGAAVPDSWALTASSALSGGDPVAVMLTPRATAADAQAVLLPPARWTLRLALDTGFQQSILTAELLLSSVP